MAGWMKTPRFSGKAVVGEGGITYYFGVRVLSPETYEKKSSKFGNFVLLRDPKDKRKLLGVEFLPKLYQDRELLQECGIAKLEQTELLGLVRLSEAALRHKQVAAVGNGAAEEAKKEKKYLQAIRHQMNDWRFPPLAELLQPHAA